MHADGLADAEWITRAVPAGERIHRARRRDRVDRPGAGGTLAQTFTARGTVTAVSVDVAGPRGANPHADDVAFEVWLEDAAGTRIAGRRVEGPQLVWEPFGTLFAVDPPAPAGAYRVGLHVLRGDVGWHTADIPAADPDDGVSPVTLDGRAFADDVEVAGERALGVETIPAPNPVFRHRFAVTAGVASARMAVVVLGNGVVRLNGRPVGEGVLEPAVTDYDRRVLYRVWDVAHLLRAGENEIEIEAGRDRFACRGGDIWGWHLASWHREPMAVMSLEVAYEDGATETVRTDASWRTLPGETERDLFFGGEDRVLRAVEPAEEPVAVVAPPRGALHRAVHASLVAGTPTPAVVVERLDAQTEVHDFGRVLAGRVQCLVTGSAGAKVTVLSGEQRGSDGRVVCENELVTADAPQRDTLTLKRSVDALEWEPRFGYRGFRWAQIRVEGDATVTLARAVELGTPLENLGRLRTDEPLLEWIDATTARSFRNNLHGVPTDTPIYEKNGWTADAHLATEALLHHFDLRAAFGKWMDDHVDAQSADGSIPWIVPTPDWGRGADPAWSASAVLIPWYLYREYGDAEILHRCLPMMRRFAEHLVSRMPAGVWEDRSWGDWLAPGGYGVGPEGSAPIGTLMAVTVLQHVAAVIRAVGAHDADRYADEASRIGAVYHDRWFDPATGSYAVAGIGYRQVLNILPLAFGIVPAAHVDSVRAGLVGDLERRTGGHLDCGAIGIRHLLPVLADAGRDDLALTVLLTRTAPGWGAWYDAGETSLRESWGSDARSRNHYFLGSVSSWIQQRVGGLRATSPGWESFEFRPVDDPRITGASLAHRTARGEAAVRWSRGSGGWLISLSVPAGVTASVRLPGFERVFTEDVDNLFVPRG